MNTKTDKTTVSSAFGNEQFVKDFPTGKVVEYTYSEYETLAEAQKEVSEKDFIDLANTRNKNNARSAAIAKATSDYKPDPNSPEQIRKRMISDAMKGNAKLSEDMAASLVDSLLGA